MAINGRRHRRTKRHTRRKTKHHKRRHKKRKTRRHRGGSRPGISPIGGSPAAPFGGKWGGKMAAFPPGPMYKPSQIGKVDALYYGKLDQPLLPDPTNTSTAIGSSTTQGKIKGGRKRRRGGRKSRKGGRKSRKGGNPCGDGRHGLNCIRCCQQTRGGPCWDDKKGKKCTRRCCAHYGIYGGGKKTRKGGRGRHKRGGGISTFLANNVPGFSDVRDVYWKGGEMVKNGYNTWFGYNKVDNTSAGVQPIGRNKDLVRPEMVDIPQNLKSSTSSAKNYNVATQKWKHLVR